MAKSKKEYPRKSFWGAEVAPGVYKTEYGDILTDRKISQGIASCLILLVSVACLIGGCTMRVHEEIQKHRAKKEATNRARQEQVVNIPVPQNAAER